MSDRRRCSEDTIFEGVPGCDVEAEESFWELGKEESGERCIFVHLQKRLGKMPGKATEIVGSILMSELHHGTPAHHVALLNWVPGVTHVDVTGIPAHGCCTVAQIACHGVLASLN